MAAWLDIVREGEDWTLVDTDRLGELVKGMPFPERQYPDLIYFAGHKSRIRALRSFLPQNNVTRKGANGLIRLHIDHKAINTDSPLMIAESNLCLQQSTGDTKWLRHATTKHRKYAISKAGDLYSAESIQEETKRQLVLPWTRVLCLFVESESDLKATQGLLQQPHRQLQVGSQAIRSSPEVIIIINTNIHGPAIASPRYEKLRQIVEGGRITFLDLSSRSSLSDTIAFEPLWALISEKLQSIHAEDEIVCGRFSAFHLSSFWGASVPANGQLWKASPLDLLAQARIGFPKTEKKDEFLHELLHSAMSSVNHSTVPEGLIEVVASAFLMDSYPPGMHGFPPSVVFTVLYEAHCTDIWNAYPFGSLTERIRSRFVERFAEFSVNRTSSSIRKDALGQFHRQGGNLYSTTTCFVCLFRPPEHMLPCTHALCDTCVAIFGNFEPSSTYQVEIVQCPICERKCNMTIRQIPPTKRPVILSLDGGGVRGLIQLGLLCALEKRIGIPIALLPDLCAGTSVGAMAAIDIFINGSSATSCFLKFPDLSRKIFRREYRHPILRYAHWLASAFNLTSHGLYDSIRLSETLQEAINPGRRVFDVPTMSPSGCRVAVVASRTSDGKACVMANYRGVGRNAAPAAYHFVTPHDNQEDLNLIEITISSVAAPFYFSTKVLPGLGPLQDGGVRANNPLSIALRESSMVWPAAERHDLLLSVGTGWSSSVQDPSSGCCSRLREGALPRLLRAFMFSPSMDGKQGYFEALNYLPHHSKPDVFRLDHEIHGPIPELDDINSLEKMLKMKFAVPDPLVRAVLATAMFFFELDETPVRSHDSFQCRGSILCARPGAVSILQRVSSIYSRPLDAAKHETSANPFPKVPSVGLSAPEINLLDHQIALARGSTMALEMTRSRLQLCKGQINIPHDDLRRQKLRQKAQQERENEFYQDCFQIFRQLIITIMESTQDLVLQYHFNPGKGPVKDPRLIRTIILLRVALDKSRAKEAEAEKRLKQQWDVSSTTLSAPGWL
ncbi:hypothetical protein N7481_010165 [Penicillium waksmanii]|uniref:uncharacterized protein n=1 Tax=Penicillium waksmanii TaxID=69791 RepID=UPI0025498C1B|nr:uncharacterized protein N7481_010165 [Penicillium waksmanii]KAJ5976458.1 hypothetical protein N7481_010165 [Penicillium waksmanii]